jgi:hypothetical protein
MSIVQYLVDNCVDFFNYSLTKLVTQQSSVAEVSEELHRFLNQIGTTVLSDMLMQADDTIYQTVKPTHQYSIKERARERALDTRFGTIRFSRRYYQDRKTKKYHYLLDEWGQLAPYVRIEPSCRAQMVAYAKDHSYQKAAALTTDCPISSQSVMNSIRRVGTIPNEASPTPTVGSDVTQVFIEADEDHVAMQQCKSKQMKMACVYEGKERVSKGRRRLVNKHVFSGYESPSKFWQEVNQYIQQVYPQNQTVSLIGDGGRWIETGTTYVRNSHHVMDGYHVATYLTKIAGNGTQASLYEAIRHDDRDGFTQAAEQKLQRSPRRKKAIESGKTYILNHWEGVRAILLDTKLVSSTEGHVSHLLSSRLSSRCMGWSPLGSEQIARLRTYAENGGNVSAYALKKMQPVVPTSIKELGKDAGLEKQIKKQMLPYCNYIADNASLLPGSESAYTGGWMRNIMNSGYHHLM